MLYSCLRHVEGREIGTGEAGAHMRSRRIRHGMVGAGDVAGMGPGVLSALSLICLTTGFPDDFGAPPRAAKNTGWAQTTRCCYHLWAMLEPVVVPNLDCRWFMMVHE